MRTAPQKIRNRTNANQANLIQSSPRTRVNRYIGRLIEARQTESDTADLNFLTLMYKCSEREQRVSAPTGTLSHPHAFLCDRSTKHNYACHEYWRPFGFFLCYIITSSSCWTNEMLAVTSQCLSETLCRNCHVFMCHLNSYI